MANRLHKFLKYDKFHLRRQMFLSAIGGITLALLFAYFLSKSLIIDKFYDIGEKVL